MTAAGFGAVTVIPIKAMIAAQGYQHAFLVFGIAQGVILAALAFLGVRHGRGRIARFADGLGASLAIPLEVYKT